MQKDEIETFCPASRQEWRKWLKKNHLSSPAVWLVQYKKKSNNPSISWSEAVDEALCFGWIDSIRKTIDDERFIQFFSKRKPKSVWSKINKEKIERLTKEGLMFPAGLNCIDIAKKNGSWSVLDEVEELSVPEDLLAAFRKHPGSKKYFTGLSRSMKKMILQWIVMAKRPVTREKRITETAELAAQELKPKQFR